MRRRRGKGGSGNRQGPRRRGSRPVRGSRLIVSSVGDVCTVGGQREQEQGMSRAVGERGGSGRGARE